jgi:hypothetical protein
MAGGQGTKTELTRSTGTHSLEGISWREVRERKTELTRSTGTHSLEGISWREVRERKTELTRSTGTHSLEGISWREVRETNENGADEDHRDSHPGRDFMAGGQGTKTELRRTTGTQTGRAENGRGAQGLTPWKGFHGGRSGNGKRS